MADPRIKTLRIKTGVLKRICKETFMYQKEATEIQEKIGNMQSQGEDPYLVGKQDGLLQETNATIADCQRRLNTAYTDLSSLVESEADLSEEEIYQAAQAVVADAVSQVTH